MGREKKVKTVEVTSAKFKKNPNSFVGFTENEKETKLVFAYYEDEITKDKKGLINNPICKVQSLGELSGYELYKIASDLDRSHALPASYVKYGDKILGSFFRIREGDSENRYFVPMIVGGRNNGNVSCLCAYNFPSKKYIEVNCPYLGYDDMIHISLFHRERDNGQQYYSYLVEK